MKDGKRFTTVNTDAGIKDGVSGYAYWIRSEHIFFVGDGKFKYSKKDSNEAELAAMLLALHIVSNDEFLRTADIIVVNCDNKQALNVLRNNKLFHTSVYYKVWNEINEKIKSPIRYKWVRGHSKGKTSREWVNNHIDSRIRRYYN